MRFDFLLNLVNGLPIAYAQRHPKSLSHLEHSNAISGTISYANMSRWPLVIAWQLDGN